MITLTVDELRDALADLPGDLLVMAESDTTREGWVRAAVDTELLGRYLIVRLDDRDPRDLHESFVDLGPAEEVA